MHNAEEFPVSQAADNAHADRCRDLSDTYNDKSDIIARFGNASALKKAG